MSGQHGVSEDWKLIYVSTDVAAPLYHVKLLATLRSGKKALVYSSISFDVDERH